jgi:hypothetical protein
MEVTGFSEMSVDPGLHGNVFWGKYLFITPAVRARNPIRVPRFLFSIPRKNAVGAVKEETVGNPVMWYDAQGLGYYSDAL